MFEPQTLSPQNDIEEYEENIRVAIRLRRQVGKKEEYVYI